MREGGPVQEKQEPVRQRPLKLGLQTQEYFEQRSEKGRRFLSLKTPLAVCQCWVHKIGV